MKSLKPKILRFASLPSTNTRTGATGVRGRRRASIVADEQPGRGRLQRAWRRREARVYFSILLQPTIPPNLWPLVTFMAALAVADALREACAVETDIKWPNDLMSGERKICGILAEAVETPTGRAVVVGIGINLTAEAYPADIAGVATGGRSIRPRA